MYVKRKQIVGTGNFMYKRKSGEDQPNYYQESTPGVGFGVYSGDVYSLIL
jgi:hypothetical protein